MGSDQYHLHVATLSRKPTKKYKNGRSSVQMAAYISGSKLHDDRRNKTFNSTYKSEVTNSELILPSCAPKEMLDELDASKSTTSSMRDFREKFWNGVESHFKAKNAQVGKTIDIAYPIEFTEEQRHLARKEFVKIFTDRGYAVDVADHLKEKNDNPHFHMQIAPNKMDKDNTWARYKEIKGYQCINDAGDKKVFSNIKAIEGYNAMHHDNFKRMPLIDSKTGKQKIARRNEKQWVRVKIEDNPLNNRESLKFWRKQWEVIANKYLSEDRKISCDSYKNRGIDKTATIHLGGKANRIKESSYRYRQNQEIMFLNMEKESMQQTNDMSTEQLLIQADNIGRMLNNSLFEDLGINEKPRHKDTSIHISNGALNARQREIEDEIDIFLKGNKEEEESEKRK